MDDIFELFEFAFKGIFKLIALPFKIIGWIFLYIPELFLEIFEWGKKNPDNRTSWKERRKQRKAKREARKSHEKQ